MIKWKVWMTEPLARTCLLI